MCKATATVYKRCYNRYINFCKTVGLSSHGHSSGRSLELWATSLSRQGLGHGTILSHLSAVRHQTRTKRLLLGPDSDRLKLILKGVKARAGKAAISKVPVSSGHLRKLSLAAKHLKTSEAKRFRAMIALAYYGFLRPSEFCTSAKKHYLLRRNVHFSSRDSDVAYLTFNSYKHSSKSVTIKLGDTSGEVLKPIRLLREYLEQSSGSPHAPLFQVSVDEFRKTLWQMCELSGIKSKLSPHCFRHGGATWASKRGWSESRIKTHGRWRSTAYNSYIKPY